jgi:G3E family GTPase
MLWRVARLDTCVTVIDAYDFPHHIASLKRFRDVFKDGLDEAGDEEGAKSIAHLLIEQVEFANVILLNKKDLVSKSNQDSTRQILQSLNPKAKIITTQYGVVLDPRIILNTKLFRMEEAAMSPGRLVSLGLGSSTPTQLVSESDEYGVSSFVYRSRKPFHPARLHDWINQVFVLIDDWNDNKKMSAMADPNDRLERATALYGQILCSKGFCWIAGGDSYMGSWTQSGQLLAICHDVADSSLIFFKSFDFFHIYSSLVPSSRSTW